MFLLSAKGAIVNVRSFLPCPQFSADLVTFTEENLNGKLHFLCSGLFIKSGNFLYKVTNYLQNIYQPLYSLTFLLLKTIRKCIHISKGINELIIFRL